MEKKYFLGVDGGGSKTTAVIFDSEGRFTASAAGESINYYSVGLAAARSNMKNIVAALFAKSGISRFECCVIGMSALGARASQEETAEFAGGIIDAEKIIMDSDVFIALKALNTHGECGVVISGTGSMAAVRTAGGETLTCGGWGCVLGDEGSGYAIALAAIKASIRGFEGSGGKTALVAECLDFFGIKDLYELIDLYYAKGVSRKETAAFAPRVFQCAMSGDAVAANIIKAQAAELFETAFCRISSLCKAAPVGLWGGIFSNNALFRDEFISLLSGKGYDNVKLLTFTPEAGAIIACFEETGIKIDSKTLDLIKSTYITE